MMANSSNPIEADLKPGICVIEASAGTGKTYTLAFLIVRMHLEKKIALEHIHAVTFTNLASEELENRVILFFKTLLDDLQALKLNDQYQGEFSHYLKKQFGSDLASIEFELKQVLINSSAINVSTIHSFLSQIIKNNFLYTNLGSQTVLQEDKYWQKLGKKFAEQFWFEQMADASFEMRVFKALFKTPGDLMKKVPMRGFVHKLPVQVLAIPNWRDAAEIEALFFEKLASKERKKIEAPWLHYFKQKWFNFLKQSVEAHALSTGYTSYDTLLGEGLEISKKYNFVQSFRKQVKALFIDEFQDTDFIQWSFIKNALITDNQDYFLYLIGDPKQSIYRFRGADLSSYYKAAQDPAISNSFSLYKNYRTDSSVIKVLNQIYTRYYWDATTTDNKIKYTAFEDDKLKYRVVKSASSTSSWFADENDMAPVSLRLPEQIIPSKKGELDEIAHQWVLQDVQEILKKADNKAIGYVEKQQFSEFSANDILILVDKNEQINHLRNLLLEQEIPVSTEVQFEFLNTQVGFYLLGFLQILQELEASQSINNALAIKLLPFLGHRLDDDKVVSNHKLMESLLAIDYLKLLKELGPYGIWQFLHGHQLLGDFGISTDSIAKHKFDIEIDDMLAVLQNYWLAGFKDCQSYLENIYIDMADKEKFSLSQSTTGVRILTIHKAKGLEASIVICPYAWSGYIKPSAESHLSIDEHSQSYQLNEEADNSETLKERHRKMYVALTRAKHKIICYWLHAKYPKTYKDAPLNHLLFPLTSKDKDIASRLTELKKIEGLQLLRGKEWLFQAATQTTQKVDKSSTNPLQSGHVTVEDLPAYQPSWLSDWELSSFTRLTHHSFSNSRGLSQSLSNDFQESLRDVGQDLSIEDNFNLVKNSNNWDPSTSLTALQVGQVVHDTLETFFKQNSDAPLLEQLEQALKKFIGLKPDAGVMSRLRSMVEATLNIAFEPNQTLANIDKHTCLTEMRFDLPIHNWNLQKMNSFAQKNSLLPLSLFKPQQLKSGIFSGFVDLIVQREDALWIIDYKTNYLGDCAEDYNKQKLEQAMLKHHYGWQAVFYAVAVDRWQQLLRQRLPIKVVYAFCHGLSIQTEKEFTISNVSGFPKGILCMPFEQSTLNALHGCLKVPEAVAC